ncbi:hypothetical protein [Polaribacter glomeratus]|uniref:DUF4129 domain-containing protein n=1 Tax=Polaribacter glomeratus TaxID=102 RepID=A0A2S7WW03_9FLAO|nr:hypothetical protein [Polaribacter glomeratus]PQJ81737.1 hypothetical protein BTO16_03760 [Polaribacter glomeratus]TXD66338.1 hypothetical protein ESX12_06015 [Polaribacter glomeratus]
MKKSIASLLLLLSFFVYAQENLTTAVEKKVDTIAYAKSTEISKERTFSSNLNETYSDKDFQYKENVPKKNDNSAPINLGIVNAFVFFMSQIFPFVLAGIIIFIILKIVLGFDFQFWKTNNTSKRKKVKLIYEDEDIHEIDLETLLRQAIEQKEFRLAIRYYYLTSLKCLSSKKIINYHKDKTNSDYIFEIQNEELKSKFSYLSYVYTYVWYGEFSVDENNFVAAQNKYQSFLKAIL